MAFSRASMEKVSSAWQASVVDFTKRNNLLFFKSKTNTLDLTEAPQENLNELFADAPISLKSLIASAAYEEAQKVAAKLLSKQKYLLEELGVSPIFLAIGFCSWIEEAANGNTPDEKRTNAPVFLLQVELENKKSTNESWKIKSVGDLKLNGVIAHATAAAKIKFDEIQFLDTLPETLTIKSLFDSLPVLSDKLCDLDEFTFRKEVQLAAFGYQDEAIYRDLADVDALMASDIVRALAGDSASISKLQKDPGISVSSPDFVKPELENLVLDADSSQIEAINTALVGTSVVVEGPPGTGKSQTIANLLAESLANGKKVLFVAQKRAAITAVLKRLETNGLNSLVLDLHDASRGPQVAKQLSSSYENMRTALPVSLKAVHSDLVMSRTKLVELKEAFTNEIRGFERNLVQLQELYYATPAEMRPEWRLDPERLSSLTEDDFNDCKIAIRDAADAGAFDPTFTTRSDSWNVETITSSQDVIDTSKRALDFYNNKLSKLFELFPHDDLRKASVASFYSRSIGVVTQGWIGELAPKLATKPLSADQLEIAIAVYDDKPIKVGLKDRVLIKFKLSVLIPGDVEVKRAALGLLDRLKKEGMAPAAGHEVPSGIDWGNALDSLNELARLMSDVQGINLKKLSINDFAKHVSTLAKDNAQFRIAKYWDADRTLSELGLDEALGHLNSSENVSSLTSGEVVSIFESAAAISLIEETLLNDDRLRGLDAATLEATTREFQRADRNHLKQNVKKILRLAAQNFQAAISQHQDEHLFLQNEAVKKKAHKPLRELIRRAPHLMVEANPIWAMSPIQVASLLPRAKYFDLVIFDEASQIRPEMAIPAIMRGKTVVVAGDSNQLPPTNFFSGAGIISDEDIEESEATIDLAVTENTLKDSESILEAMERVVGTRKKRLLWHYRSRDERLIALSNIEIYGNSLTTFPASDTPDALKHVLVTSTKHKPVASGSQNNEAAEVIELIKQHSVANSAESLGVITFGINHLKTLEMALAEARRKDPVLDSWLDSGTKEPFFMKNLERVQGDERDAIIISTGYGKDTNGRLSLKWGPLTSEAGRRRLNVAISRAKRRMTLVSNFTLADLSDVKVREGTGVELYKKFLDYVTHNGEHYADAASTIELNGFELDIKRRLEAEGLKLVPQFGVCNYRIDFAVRHPKNVNEFVLAIEADGASYHSGHIARERDRLRQMLLEDRGWNFHRIWSTDWFSNPDREVQRVLETYNAALKSAKNAKVLDTAIEPEIEIATNSTAKRSKHPGYGFGAPIDQFSDSQIDLVVKYIVSDHLLRTDDEIIEEAAKDILGYSKIGAKIKRRIEASIARVVKK